MIAVSETDPDTDRFGSLAEAATGSDAGQARIPFSSIQVTVDAEEPPMCEQTKTPYQLLDRAHNAVLVEEFFGKPITTLRTPAMIIDRKLFAENCARMHQKSKSWGAGFRAHLKTHKVISMNYVSKTC